MTAFKNTIVGRILRGVSKVALPVAGVGAAIVTGGAAVGILSGAGAIGGAVKAAGAIKKVGQAAVNLVTGTTKAEREQVNQVKAVAKAEQDKLDQVERLISAGATRAEAEKMVGITPSELGSADAAEKESDTALKEKLEEKKPIQAGQGCLTTSILLLAAGSIPVIYVALRLIF